MRLEQYFEKQRVQKLKRGRNWNEDLRRTSSEIDEKRSLELRLRERRQDPQHSKNTYVPAIQLSRNYFIYRQTRASAVEDSTKSAVEDEEMVSLLLLDMLTRLTIHHRTGCFTISADSVSTRGESRELPASMNTYNLEPGRPQRTGVIS